MFDANLRRLFNTSETIAVVGLSGKPHRVSYRIGKYLKDKGFRVIPVNPNEEEIFGEKSYASLLDIPRDIKIDIVNVFRRSEYVEEVAKEAVEMGCKFFWSQLGIYSKSAEVILEEKGIPFLMNTCILIEHQRLFS